MDEKKSEDGKWQKEVTDYKDRIDYAAILESAYDNSEDALRPDDIPDFFENGECEEYVSEVSIISALLPGLVKEVCVNEGDYISNNSLLLIFEMMKMESELLASKAGIIEKIFIKKGEKILKGQTLFTVRPGENKVLY